MHICRSLSPSVACANATVHRWMHDALQRSLRLPWHSIPASVSTRLRLLGFPHQVFDITHLSLASRARCWLQSAIAEECWSAVQNAQSSDDARMVLPFPGWMQHSVLFQWRAAFSHCYSLPATRPICRDADDDKVQRKLYRALHSEAYFEPFRSALIRRASRWDSDRPADLVNFILTLTCSLRDVVPLTVRTSFVLAFLNAWQTPARFQQCRTCPLCRGLDGGDVEHFLRCPCWEDRVHSAYQIDISNVNGSLVSYIARLPVGSSGQLRLLFFVDGVYRSLHVLRHAGRTVALNAPIARLHAVLRLHPRCRTLFDR